MRDSCYIILFAQNFDNGHGKFKLELSEYFQMNQCQLSFSMFYATSFSFLQFIIFFCHLTIILMKLNIFILKMLIAAFVMIMVLMWKKYWWTRIGFIRRHKFSNGGNWTQRSLPDIFIRCIITELKDFTRTGIEKVSRSVRHVSI